MIADDQLAAIIAAARAATEPPAVPPPTHIPPLDTEITRIIADADAGAARSQQRLIGPSEIGEPCDRFVAYKLLDVDPVNTGRDNWLANLGTAMHAWLADAFSADNTVTPGRWLIEQRVWLNDALSGSCDLYDTWTGTVIDHKLLGTTSLRKIRNDGPPPKYMAQLHLYGYGHARAGRDVTTVVLACYPRNDNLAGEFGGQKLLTWSAPYDPQIARDALDRIASITATATVLDVTGHPERWPLIPAKPGDDCKYCPFFAPANTTANQSGCPGPTTTPPTLPTHIPGLT